MFIYVTCVMIYSICSYIVYTGNLGLSLMTVLYNSSLILPYIAHCNRKCASVSTTFEQKEQNLISLGILRCRPISIIRLWLESLNLVTCFLISGFLISDRYFSGPILFLKIPYVLSLLLSFLIVVLHGHFDSIYIHMNSPKF